MLASGLLDYAPIVIRTTTSRNILTTDTYLTGVVNIAISNVKGKYGAGATEYNASTESHEKYTVCPVYSHEVHETGTFWRNLGNVAI